MKETLIFTKESDPYWIMEGGKFCATHNGIQFYICGNFVASILGEVPETCKMNLSKKSPKQKGWMTVRHIENAWSGHVSVSGKHHPVHHTVSSFMERNTLIYIKLEK